MDKPSFNLNGIEYNGEQIAYKDSTYELVSKASCLIGVPLRIFQNEHEPPKMEIYNRLELDKKARIIRNLCIIRTAIERNYRKSMTSCGWSIVGCCPCRRLFHPAVCSSSHRTASTLSRSPARNCVSTLLK